MLVGVAEEIEVIGWDKKRSKVVHKHACARTHTRTHTPTHTHTHTHTHTPGQTSGWRAGEICECRGHKIGKEAEEANAIASQVRA